MRGKINNLNIVRIGFDDELFKNIKRRYIRK